jgi:hypothetical protein
MPQASDGLCLANFYFPFSIFRSGEVCLVNSCGIFDNEISPDYLSVALWCNG